MKRIDFTNFGPPAISEETLEALQDNIEESIQALGSFSSSEEVETEEKWTDGKTIYKKTFIKNGTGTINIADLNIERAFFDFSNSHLSMINPDRVTPLATITIATAESPGRRQAGVFFDRDYTIITIECGDLISL